MNFSPIIENPEVKIEKRLSQGQLNVLQTCPRKFQYTFLDKLGSPVTPEQQEKMAWGSRFHLLMQQRELGLPVEFLLKEDDLMTRCYRGLLDAAPEIFSPHTVSEDGVFREAEQGRTLNFHGYLLTVIYDLLIADEITAHIFDWKTYPLPENHRKIEQNWQTRLYPFVLAETSDYQPERISMTYWFVQSAAKGDRLPKSQRLSFDYNEGKHRQTHRDLEELLGKLTEWLQRYDAGEPFPQVSVTAGICQYCPFAIRCQGAGEGREPTIAGDRWSNIGDIEEVAL